MSYQVDELLQNVREAFVKFEQSTYHLASSHPSIFDDKDFSDEYQKLRLVFDEARSRLERPRLVVATFGTTSAGKSTIVNALVGRRIAPIENGEMSAGILKICPNPFSRLVIHKSQENEWESGDWANISDREIYDRVQKVMSRYHETRKTKSLSAPWVEVHGSMLPTNDKSLLSLHPEIEFELIDLPGLKSVSDRDNLAVIQDQVKKAFCIVALDYSQVDEEHRAKLLQELKEVVEYLNGRTDTMIFILNRVDRRGKEDKPIEEVIGSLKSEIKCVLNLDEEPILIPFCARLLYYAQCAWGPVAQSGNSRTEPGLKKELIEGLIADCGDIIRKNIGSDQKLKKWYRGLEDDLEYNNPISEENLRRILTHARDWSGGTELWQEIRTRIESSFPTVVLSPILLPLFLQFDSFVAETALKKRILETDWQDVQAYIEVLRQVGNSIRPATEEWKNLAISKYRETIDKVKDVQESLDIQDLKDIKNVLALIQDKLNEVIDQFSEYFTKNKSLFDFQDDLEQRNIQSYDAKNICKCMESVRDNLRDYSPIAEEDESGKPINVFVVKVKESDEAGKEKLNEIEKSYKNLYNHVEILFGKLTEFHLQARMENLIMAMQTLVNSEVPTEDIFRNLLDPKGLNILESLDLIKMIEAKWALIIKSNPIQVPEELFEFSQDGIAITDEFALEKTGTREVEYTENIKILWITIPWFSVKKIREEDVMESITYKQIRLPAFDFVIKDWRKNMDDQINNLLLDVIKSYLDKYYEGLKTELDKLVTTVVTSAEEKLKEQTQQTEEELNDQKKRWSAFESDFQAVETFRTNLNHFISPSSSDEN